MSLGLRVGPTQPNNAQRVATAMCGALALAARARVSVLGRRLYSRQLLSTSTETRTRGKALQAWHPTCMWRVWQQRGARTVELEVRGVVPWRSALVVVRDDTTFDMSLQRSESERCILFLKEND